MPQIKLALLCLVGLVEFGVARRFTFVFEHTSEVAEDLLQNLDRLPEFLDTHVNVYERNGGERRRVYVHPTQCFINTDIVRKRYDNYKKMDPIRLNWENVFKLINAKLYI